MNEFDFKFSVREKLFNNLQSVLTFLNKIMSEILICRYAKF